MPTPQEREARSLALHRLVAEKLRRQPERLDKVRLTLKRWQARATPQVQGHLAEWQALLDQGLDSILAVVEEDSERGRALRKSSPFAGILTLHERMAFFRAWRGYPVSDLPPSPRFLDIEAAGLTARTYPIEVAWSDEAGSIESYLIDPCSVPEWAEFWDAGAERVHRISPETLAREGREPAWVAARLNAALAGKRLYSDAVEWDRHWLDQLFEVADFNRDFELADIAELFEERTPNPWGDMFRDGWLIDINSLSDAAWTVVGEEARHRAATDVLHHILWYQLVLEQWWDRFGDS